MTALAILSLLVSLFAVTRPAQAAHVTGEDCPPGQVLLVTFNWTGTAWAAEGGDAKGVTVTGTAQGVTYQSTQAVAGLVVTAGTSKINLVVDLPDGFGSLLASDFDAFGGADLAHIGFCTGPLVDPTSGSRISVEVAKTAECAPVGPDGMATATGTITVTRHPVTSLSVRIKTARDFILGPGDAIVTEATVASLSGVVLNDAAEEVTVPYSITFDPADATSFTNFIQVTIEEEATGLDRHKLYNARASFELCELTQVTAAAATVTPPSCTAAGTLVIPANTTGVTYSVSPAYTAGATGTFTVTATANAGFELTGTSQWTLTVLPQLTGDACATAATAAAASVTPPSCTAAGTLVIPADTASVMYSVSPAYSAGASGTFTVTATAKAGFVLSGTTQWTLTVAPQVTGAACVTGGGTLPSTAAPARQGTLAGSSVPNTATDGSPIDAPVVLLALLALGGLSLVAQRNIVAIRARR